MDLLTTRRHLLAAVFALGAHDGTIEQRLHAAYERGLRRISASPGLPDHMRTEYDALMAELADFLGGHGEMDGQRASRLAKRVVMLYQRAIKEC